MKEIYICLQDIKTDKDKVKMDLFCDVYCSDSILQKQIQNYEFTLEQGLNRITALYIIMVINEIYKDAKVMCIGDTKCFVNYEIVKKGIVKKTILFALSILILFFGGAITIINFHNDVDMPNVYENIYKFFGGEGKPPYMMGILYSVGVFIGFVSILNIFSKANRTPGILDLEISSHRKEVITFKHDFLERKGK